MRRPDPDQRQDDKGDDRDRFDDADEGAQQVVQDAGAGGRHGEEHPRGGPGQEAAGHMQYGTEDRQPEGAFPRELAEALRDAAGGDNQDFLPDGPAGHLPDAHPEGRGGEILQKLPESGPGFTFDSRSHLSAVFLPQIWG